MAQMSACKYFKWLLIGLLAAVTMPAAAQTHYKPHITIGGRLGATMAKQDIASAVPQGWLTGTTGAVMVCYAEERLVGIQAELGWTQRGWKEDFEEAPLEYSRTLTYITLPILTHISFGPKRTKFFFNLGPELAYMVGSSISANFDYRDLSTVTTWPQRRRQTEQLAMDIANRFDYGITAGFGLEFFMKPQHSVLLEARYYFGLGNIFKSSKADTFSASRSTSIEITLGYNFRIK